MRYSANSSGISEIATTVAGPVSRKMGASREILGNIMSSWVVRRSERKEKQI